ncbi:MAG: GNAT family N-acetyltransferase [Alphaproteobacteria bacterium]|nr:GNAT family N-acetyltransferase [Alphaproteobacteria bacterium]
MAVEILRIGPHNAGILDHVDPEIFDDEIDRERVAAFVATENHLLVVAQDAGCVIGQIRAIVHLQPDGANQLYIDNLGVAPTHLRRGIASLLLQDVLSWGEARGCEDAWVATELDNEAARGLYARFMSEPEQTMAYFQIDIP